MGAATAGGVRKLVESRSCVTAEQPPDEAPPLEEGDIKLEPLTTEL